MNYIDYIQHAVFSPDTYHRRFDLDLPEMQETVKRAALAVLPFIGLYRPAGCALSIGMNGTRTISHFQNALVSEETQDWIGCALETGKASLGMISLATTFYHFAPALFLTTSIDTLQGAASTGTALWNGDYSKAVEEGLQTLASAAYLAFMATGGLEAMLAFALLHATVNLYQARREISQGRYIEGFAKLAMAGIRFNQANGYVEQIQRRNAYLEMERIRAVFLRIMGGRQAGHLIHHPLSSLKERIAANEVAYTDGKGNEVTFGAHFHGNGQALVKGENLEFRTRIINGKEVTELDFKVNHAFRSQIDAALKELKNIKPKEMKEILALTGSHAKGISFEAGSFLDKDGSPFFNPGAAHKIRIEGLGTILIGASADQPNFYDRVIVQLNANQSLFELHEMLSFVNLDKAIRLSTAEDIERLKMGHLYRTFFPKEATPFERTAEYFTMPLSQLKQKMIEKSPDMKDVMDTYLHKMRQEQLVDGRVRYRIDGLAEAAYEKGARALTAAVLGAYKDEDLYERVVSMLRMGMLATEMRDKNDIGSHGLGGFGADYMSGGADSVFTQLITEKNCTDKMSFNNLNYNSKVRFVIGLEALEMGTYQYHSDSFGTRVYKPTGIMPFWFPNKYAEREGILEFIQKEQASKFVNSGHEVMLKERVAPSFFKGLIVPDEKTKTGLLDYLRASGLVQNETILNTSVDKFIRVGKNVTEELIS